MFPWVYIEYDSNPNTTTHSRDCPDNEKLSVNINQMAFDLQDLTVLTNHRFLDC